MPAFEDRGQFLWTGEEVSIQISPLFVNKGLDFLSRDAGRSEDGACFRL